MFFEASKVLGFFAAPSNFLITLALVGAALMATRSARAGRRLLVGATILIAVCGLLPVGSVLLSPLEDRFAAWDPSRGAPDGIVVLGGATDGLVAVARGEPALNEAAERMTATVELARRYPRARLVYSGGSSALFVARGPEAAVARQLFERLGIEPARIELEDRSRNTVENAAFSKRVAAPKPGERWLLVTSASHMPRAIGTFRRVGFPVEAYPTDWRTRGMQHLPASTWLVSEGLRRTDAAVHEWFGLLAYWLAGHTSELLPGAALRAGCDNASGPEACRR
jgi:uncharacterized SAM-binding protein YcdF (DUF218 family)